MPAIVMQKGKKWRVCERSGSLVMNSAGTPVDGGGYNSRQKALAQATAINISQHKRNKGQK